MTKAEDELGVMAGLDPFLGELARNADRVWYFDEGPKEWQDDRASESDQPEACAA